MSAYPLMLEGASLSALVVGGGRVATRRVRSLLAAGAAVRVIARSARPELEALAGAHSNLHITIGSYAPAAIADADLVIAATDDAAVNAAVAADARAAKRLVNVAHAPELGTCIVPAVHRAGDVVVAVTAGGVPAAAARIRDEIAHTVDHRYGDALGALAALRRALLEAHDREAWARATGELLGPEFCRAVEDGRLAERVRAWR